MTPHDKTKLRRANKRVRVAEQNAELHRKLNMNLRELIRDLENQVEALQQQVQELEQQLAAKPSRRRKKQDDSTN